jgi:hypothetical protein
MINKTMEQNSVNIAIILPIAGTLIATVISSLVAALVSFFLNRQKEKERFDLQLQNILQFSVQYPYLENSAFTNTWEPELTNDEKYQRYENYCTLLFNYLADLYEWFKYNQKKIESYIDIKNWVRIHKKCWKHPSLEHENVDVYGEKFSTLIDNYLR